MATNDFLPFANGGGANVLTQAQYAALTTLLSGGYQSGVANSAQMNKTWRQSSIMAAVLGQFAADYSGNNSVDDGTTATLEANLVAAIRSASKTGVILADTGAANAYTAVNVPPLTSGTWVDGVVQQVRIAHANTGASTYAPDGLTSIPIYGLGLQPLQGSELALNGIAILVRMTITGVNGGNPIAVLLECAGGAQQVAPATQSQHAVQLGQLTGTIGSRTNLKASCLANATTITFTADQIIVGSALNGLQYALPSFNKTLNLATTGAGGMDTGTATAGAWLAVYAIYNPTTQTSALLGTLEGASAASTVYAGGSMPAGYSASALLAVIPVSSTAGQLKGCLVNGRRVNVPKLLTFNTSSTTSTSTAIALAGAIPKAAVRVSGVISVGSTVSSQIGMAVDSDSALAIGDQNVSVSNSVAATGPFALDIFTTQTIYYVNQNSTGTPTFSLLVSSYEI
jgi:hypothetical protein